MHSILSLTDTQYVQDVSASEAFFSVLHFDIFRLTKKFKNSHKNHRLDETLKTTTNRKKPPPFPPPLAHFCTKVETTATAALHCPCCVTFASFAESLARAIKRKNQSKSSGKNSNMVANKEDTREELAMMDVTEDEAHRELDEKLLLMDEPSCVQRWLSFENEKKNNGDESLNREIETYRKLIQNELKKGAHFQKNSSASGVSFPSFLQLQLETTTTTIDDDIADSTGNEMGEDGEAAATNAHNANTGEEEEAETYDVDLIDPKEWMVPPQCIPVHANVTTFDWKPMYEHTKFDVIMMDPPWQLATANPTRGVSLGYSQLTDAHIANLPIPELQENGFLFVWVINAKYQWCLNQFKKWGYEFVDEIAWVKVTNSRRLAKSHGFYLQHAKEVCLVARRGKDPPGTTLNGKTASDVIFAARRGQSQKPTEIYELIEQLVPNGKYLEIFARKNNLRDYWVSVGNEVTGTGLPPEDVKAFAEVGAVPAAKYGAAAQK